MTEAASRKTILAADIGGTHSRFALFRIDMNAADPLEGMELVRRVRFATHANENTGHMLRTLAECRGDDGGWFMPASEEPVHIDAAVFAIPGPVAVADISVAPPDGEICYCPNITWALESGPVMAALEGAPVRFINDFVANGFACAMLPRLIDAVTVLPGVERPGFPKAVIGAGTGLGHCLVLPGATPVVAGSEAGHALFPFTDEEEGIRRYLTGLHGTDRIANEWTVAGNALANIYAYCTGETVHPHEASSLAAENPVVLELVARFYGRCLQHYILNTLPLGGLYITGGLAANLPQVLTHPSFIAELRTKNVMGATLGAIPVRHVRNGDLGLWGSAAYASLLLGTCR